MEPIQNGGLFTVRLFACDAGLGLLVDGRLVVCLEISNWRVVYS